MLKKIAVTYTDITLKKRAQQLAAQIPAVLIDPGQINPCGALLTVTAERLELSLNNNDSLGFITVDFLEAGMLHRYRHGGSRKELLARAVGLHKKKNLTVCDISAGLGRDAMILAALGAQVTMIERSPVIGALLLDGWERARQTDWIAKLAWHCIITDSRDYLRQLPASQYPQVIYFDPMFPERKKSALVKKAMRILREIIGEDLDAAELLDLALKTATSRVVVKRPRLAQSIPGPAPSFNLEGQSSRFDVYLC